MYWSTQHPEPIPLARPGSLSEHLHIRPEVENSDIDQKILLREMQHLVANSRQIVASILSLKAKTVTSEEARFHLMDAYHRVMSIAVVQRQLLASKYASTIQIEGYLTELSEGLGASLAEKVRLSVVVDGAAAIESSKAVAIGLVITELVVNALKHAYPQKRRGTIVVGYQAVGPDWSLSVSDDGVGLARRSVKPGRSGYGTGIVDALAKELDAQVLVKSSSEGTRVSLIHSAGCGKPGLKPSIDALYQV